jgi:hypothetical protein
MYTDAALGSPTNTRANMNINQSSVPQIQSVILVIETAAGENG